MARDMNCQILRKFFGFSNIKKRERQVLSLVDLGIGQKFPKTLALISAFTQCAVLYIITTCAS